MSADKSLWTCVCNLSQCSTSSSRKGTLRKQPLVGTGIKFLISEVRAWTQGQAPPYQMVTLRTSHLSPVKNLQVCSSQTSDRCSLALLGGCLVSDASELERVLCEQRSRVQPCIFSTGESLPIPSPLHPVSICHPKNFPNVLG